MRASDGRVLRVLATESLARVLDELATAPFTQAELAERFFDGKSPKASETLSAAEDLGVIARPGGRKQPYVLVHPRETMALLLAAAELAEALSTAQARADAHLAKLRRERSP